MAPNIFCTFGVVNLKLRIATISLLMLGMMTLMPSICFSRTSLDSLVLKRIWSYRRNYTRSVNGLEQNMYLRYTFNVPKRNPTLFLVPNMYTVARGDRTFIGESYCKVRFRKISDFDLDRLVVCGTIPHNRFTMSNVAKYITPNLYGMSIYNDEMLSPFHRANRFYYSYRVSPTDEKDIVIVRFKPHIKNTQLVSGHAMVNFNTGQLLNVVFEGEFDMVNFKVTAVMNRESIDDQLPERCITEARFKMLGNKVNATFSAVYNCQTQLPDSLENLDSREVMGTLRPIPLKKSEEDIYLQHDSLQQAHERADSVAEDTTSQRRPNRIVEFLWDVIGDNLISSTHAKTGAVSVYVSPLLNPLYLGYHGSRGISYKIRLGFRYNWNANRYLTLNPQLGYNFKLKQFYYEMPLRMTYNPKRNGYAQITWANGNRISNGALVDDIHKQMGETFDVPEFKDESVTLLNNVEAFDWLEITTGIVYHRRRSGNRTLMRELGRPEEYRSFAPMLALHITPWATGPLLTVNYERSIQNVMRSNLNYERWELDASYKQKLPCMRYLNVRGGAGFYTHRSTDYFVDFTNFHDNNLPTGWEDDYTGQFQLLDSRWYNASDYYLRGHISYESPMLALTWLPWAGRYIEKERLYASILSIENTHAYTELGYGFTNRFFSTGIFASFLNYKFQELSMKFTIELFRRW